MKLFNTRPVVSVKVIANSSSRKNIRWAKIVDAKTGKVLHTGQPRYIQTVARKRYDRIVNLV